jgi:simple sugar transport system permease protein
MVGISDLSFQIKAALIPGLAVVLCLGAALGALWALGYSPGLVLSTVWRKVLWRAEPRLRMIAWGNILQYSTPILLTGLAVSVAFRASVWNIGAQGQLLLGALAANAVGAYLGAGPALLILALLLGAMAAGALGAAVAAGLHGWRGVPVVLSTLLLNFIVIQLMRYLIDGPLADPDPARRGQSLEISRAAWLGTWGAARLHIGFFIGAGAAVILELGMRFTTFGFRLRMTGQNATAARFAGVNVARVSFLALSLSGALAGLAGGVEVAGVRHALDLSDAASGFGFTGIAAALLARLSPVGVIASAIFFGVLRASFLALESEAQVASVTGQAIGGMAVILMLILTHRGGRK